MCKELLEDISYVSFFGVYDGHGGVEAADYLCKHLHVNFVEALRRYYSWSPQVFNIYICAGLCIACSPQGVHSFLRFVLAAAAGHTVGGWHRLFERHSVARMRPCSPSAEARRRPPTTAERSRAGRRPRLSCCWYLRVRSSLPYSPVSTLSTSLLEVVHLLLIPKQQLSSAAHPSTPPTAGAKACGGTRGRLPGGAVPGAQRRGRGRLRVHRAHGGPQVCAPPRAARGGNISRAIVRAVEVRIALK